MNDQRVWIAGVYLAGWIALPSVMLVGHIVGIAILVVAAVYVFLTADYTGA